MAPIRFRRRRETPENEPAAGPKLVVGRGLRRRRTRRTPLRDYIQMLFWTLVVLGIWSLWTTVWGAGGKRELSTARLRLIGVMRSFLLLLALAPLAFGSYFLPAIAERHYVLADTWSIKGDHVFVTHGKKKYTFKVDVFWLADRINSGSICTGSHKQAMRAYLDTLAKRKKKPPLFLELINLKKGKKLFVAGVWPHEKTKMLLRMKAGVSPKLLPYADAIKLKDPKTVDALLKKASAAGWKALQKKKP